MLGLAKRAQQVAHFVGVGPGDFGDASDVAHQVCLGPDARLKAGPALEARQQAEVGRQPQFLDARLARVLAEQAAVLDQVGRSVTSILSGGTRVGSWRGALGPCFASMFWRKKIIDA